MPEPFPLSGVSRPGRSRCSGRAQAFHASAAMSPMLDTTRTASSPLTILSLVSFRSRPESLEDDLVRPARGALAIVRAAHCPGEQGQTENIPGNERGRSRQILHMIGDEMWPASDSVLQVAQPAMIAGDRLIAVAAAIPRLRDDAARQLVRSL